MAPRKTAKKPADEPETKQVPAEEPKEAKEADVPVVDDRALHSRRPE